VVDRRRHRLLPAVAFGLGTWIAVDPAAQLAVAPPEVVQQLVTEDFEDYYSSNPAQDFAAQVFTNNAYVAAQSILFGVLLGSRCCTSCCSTPSTSASRAG
jgi:uncharacterized membrane protein SpoIIM required for sporulation